MVNAYQPHDAPEKKSQSSDQCFAYGCPRMPTFYSGGEGSCRWHYRRPASSLQHITHALRQNEILVDWYDAVLQACYGDYDMGEVHRRAPYGMGPNEDEKFVEYKVRLRKIIEEKIYPKPTAGR